MAEGQIPPTGIRLSAVFLALLGCLIGFYAPFYLAMMGLVIFRRLHSHYVPGPSDSLLNLLIVISVAAGVSYLCFRAATALRHCERWAAYFATAFGLLLFIFGAKIIRDLFLPYAPGAIQGEDFFEFLTGVPCIVLGLWWCVYLNLPHVRRSLR